MLKIRLSRRGARNKPFYRIVVSESRGVPTASALDEVGYYDPGANPAEIQIDGERLEHWVQRGAQMTPTVKKLIRQQSEAPAQQ